MEHAGGQEVIIKKTGKKKRVENNIAHTMIEKGEAILASQKKAFDEAPKDKMISEKRIKVRKK